MSRGPRRRRRQTAVSSPYQRRSNRSSSMGWLFLGLMVGLLGSLYYAWIINPVVYSDAIPSRLSEANKRAYVELVGQTYLATGDWESAQLRLNGLEEENVADTVALYLEEAIRNRESDRSIRALAALGQQLGVQNQTVALFAPTPATAVPTPTTTLNSAVPTATASSTPTPTVTTGPTRQPTATSAATNTPQPNFRLLDQQQICGQVMPQIAVIVLDALLDPQPGVEVLIQWEGGSDHFFTGFKPEIGLGYGDFTMSPDLSYSVMLADGSPEISGLRIEQCEDGSEAGWELTFQNLRLSLPNDGES